MMSKEAARINDLCNKYIDDITAEFRDQPQVIEQFMEIMRDFNVAPAADIHSIALNTVKRVCDLFSGHPDLFRGLELFLPPRYALECTCDEAGIERATLITPESYEGRPLNRHARGSS